MNWKRSTRCSTGACLWIRLTDDGRVHVSDEHGGVIELRADVWEDILYEIGAGEDHPLPTLIRPVAGGVVWSGRQPWPGRGPVPAATLRYTAVEWAEFLAAVRRGEFTVEGLAA